MTITTLSNDSDIQTAVHAALEWDPEVNAARIGVAVDDGTVSLSGDVDTYLQRVAAVAAALRVWGVRTAVDEIVVHPGNSRRVTETDLAKSVQAALEWTANVPETVKATLVGRHATLSGEVEWNFQRESARRTIEHVEGIDHLDNLITLRDRPAIEGTDQGIRAALKRDANIEGQDIHVHVDGTHAALSGTVRSWTELRAAEDAVWASPHITSLRNDLHIRRQS